MNLYILRLISFFSESDFHLHDFLMQLYLSNEEMKLFEITKNKPYHDDQREKLNNICENHPICGPLFRTTLNSPDIYF